MHTILSFDVDRTLVNRNVNSHTISPRMRSAIYEASSSADVSVLLNTGRDLTALKEIDHELGLTLDAFFLSGRGERFRQQIFIDQKAILPSHIFEKLFEKATYWKIPFLDVKTGEGVMQVSFEETNLPFGLQKPRNWYMHYQPHLVDSQNPVALAEINRSQPLRLEIPMKAEHVSEITEHLSLPVDSYLQVQSVHEDYLHEDPERFKDWAIVLLLSSIDKNNKGTCLQNFVKRFNGELQLVHFGDSSSRHNSDELVKELIPQTRYVNINWNDTQPELVENKIVETIQEYI